MIIKTNMTYLGISTNEYDKRETETNAMVHHVAYNIKFIDMASNEVFEFYVKDIEGRFKDLVMFESCLIELELINFKGNINLRFFNAVSGKIPFKENK